MRKTSKNYRKHKNFAFYNTQSSKWYNKNVNVLEKGNHIFCINYVRLIKWKT